jgi:glycosyltransferase involved in cell wall biosynthesis
LPKTTILKKGSRIICLVSNDLTYDQRMQRTCTSLTQGGFDVTLVGRQRKSSVPLDKKPFKQVRLKLAAETGKTFYASLNLKLLQYLLRQDFDAVCAVDLDTILPAYLAAKMKSKKLVYDAHEYFPEVPELINRPFEQGIWRRLEKWLVPKVDAAYTVSEGIAAIFRKAYNKPFEVVMNAPVLKEEEEEELSYGRAEERFLLYQGALNKGRGLEAIIMTMAFVEAKLVIAGEGDLSVQLREMVKKMNLQEKVEFKGFVKPDELRQLTQQAYIGINLAENLGLSYYHSLNNKFFDYIHAALPSITIGFPEFQRINSRHEVTLLVQDLIPEHLAKSINLLLQDSNLYEKLQENCVKAREIYNWQNEEKKLIAIYENL